MDLTLVLAGVIVVAVIAYVVLDGFDLGIGVLFPFARTTAQRDLMIGSIAPVWDGNETWLVLAGGGLLAAFPGAYAVALPAFYLPLMGMLFCLIFRGVAFEFRMKATTTRWIWSTAFAAGSMGAGFLQGMLLGGLIQGVTVIDGHFAGGSFDFLSWFTVMTGLGVMAGYALLGAGWLIIKTQGTLQGLARHWARLALVATMAAMAVVSGVTPLLHDSVAERWFGGWNLAWLAWVPLAAAALALLLWRDAMTAERRPFFTAIGLFLLGMFGIAYSLYPNIVPPSVTYWDATVPETTQVFLLIAIAVTLPMVLVYTVYAYRSFRGKVRPGQGYH